MLELRNVSFLVDAEGKDKEIIRNVSLTVPDRKLVVVTGPNGGGKSTLAKLIAGIEKPTGGHIFFNGEDITELGITERAQKGIAYAFQQPVRFKGIRVLDLIRIAAGKTLSISDACEYLSSVGLCARDYVDREVNASLSGGELKRIEIATVLARKAVLSVFDEPEAGIDLWSFRNLTEVFQRMREDIRDSSILIISHQERILNIADEVIVLKDGRLTAQGSREKVLPGLIGTASAVKECWMGAADKGGSAEMPIGFHGLSAGRRARYAGTDRALPGSAARLSRRRKRGAHVLIAQQFHTTGQRVDGTDDLAIEDHQKNQHYHQHALRHVEDGGVNVERQPHQQGKQANDEEGEQEEVIP